LQLPATIEEQQPLDLEAMRSGDAETCISGELPSVTTRPVGRSDGALEEFLPSYKAQNTGFANGPPAPYRTLAPSWKNAGNKTVKQVDNSTLAEYLIGSEAKIVLSKSYWPKDKVSWTTQCMDHCENKRAKGNHMFKCVLLESTPRYVGGTGEASTYEAELSAWHVRNALEQQHGGHKTLDEMFGGKTRGLLGLATDRLCSAVRSTAARIPGGKIRRQESSNTMGASMIGMIWTAMDCDEHGQQFAGMRPVPRSYISQGDPTGTFGQRPATRRSRSCLTWARSQLWMKMTFLLATRASTAACHLRARRMATAISWSIAHTATPTAGSKR